MDLINLVETKELPEVIFGTIETDILYGTQNEDYIQGLAGDDKIYGGKGNDRILGGSGNDTLYGGQGNDRIIGGEGDDILYGGYGNDALIGGYGNDVLHGGYGNDRLSGGVGQDTLTGGEGADTFFFRALGDQNVDTVTDFSVTDGDTLDFSVLVSKYNLEDNLITDYLTFTTVGNDTVITFNAGGQDTGQVVAILTGINDIGLNELINSNSIIV